MVLWLHPLISDIYALLTANSCLSDAQPSNSILTTINECPGLQRPFNGSHIAEIKSQRWEGTEHKMQCHANRQPLQHWRLS